MEATIVSTIAFLISSFSSQKDSLVMPISQSQLVQQLSSEIVEGQENILAQNILKLGNRDTDPGINRIFVDNILLNLHYLCGNIKDLVKKEKDETKVYWDEVRKPFEFSLFLPAGTTFAFHSNLLPEFEGELVVTAGNQFSAKEGYKEAYGIYGNGVCHLASLMNWTASQAGLEVVAKKNHDFSPIPDVPQKFGTLISYQEDNEESQEKNLYIKNNLGFTVVFQFRIDDEQLELTILKP